MCKAGSVLSKQELNCRDEKEITVRFESVLTQDTRFFSLSLHEKATVLLLHAYGLTGVATTDSIRKSDWPLSWLSLIHI